MPYTVTQRSLKVLSALFAPTALPPGELLPPSQRDDLLGACAQALAYMKPELHNAERIPTGGALLVGNHALMGIDSFALYPLLVQHTGRLPRGLADRALWRVPLLGTGLGRGLERMGAVQGTPDAAEKLLKAGEMVLVYPGGGPESFKPPKDHYKLLWADRLGFIRVALRAQVPIVPIMAAGTDHAYRYLFRDRWIARRVAGGARYDFPVSLGLGVMPLPGKFTYHVGEPILPPGGPELEDDPDALAAFHQHVWQTAQGQLDAAVAQWRAEIGLPPRKRPRR